MRILVMAPPYIKMPPMRYGGIEAVAAPITNALVDLGYEVTLACAPGSTSKAEMIHPLPRAYPEKIGQVVQEVDHVTRVLDYLDDHPFDVIHDHTMAGLTMARRIETPMVHTMHNGHAGDLTGFYQHRSDDALLVAISQDQYATAPEGIKIAKVIPNPITVDDWPYQTRKRDYALWVGRLDEPKGPDRAIKAIKKTDMKLILAGPVQMGAEGYFRDQVAPHIDNDQIKYIGEIGGNRKKILFANASALLMPIRWDEPFGMVMIEALACGTPVIAFPHGAAKEIVIHGTNGYLVADEIEMSDALLDVGMIHPGDCRMSVVTRYDTKIITDAYVDVYNMAVRGH